MRVGTVYFAAFGALGALNPYYSLFFAERGFSPLESAMVMAIWPVANLIAPPLWGGVADRTGHRPRTLAMTLAGASLCTALYFPTWGLLGVIVAMASLSLMNRAHAPLTDAIAHGLLGPRANQFAWVRVWGSVGFALVVLGVGFLPEAMASKGRLGLAAIFYLAGAMLARTIDAPHDVDLTFQPRASLWRDRKMVVFLVASALYFGVHVVHDLFFSLYVQRAGLDTSVVGMAWSLGVGVEIAVMIVAPRLLSHMPVPVGLCLCAVAAVTRWLVLSAVPSPAWIVGIQALHGLTFGLWYLCSVHWIQGWAPPTHRASVLARLSMAMGLGALILLLAGGACIERLGIPTTYRLAAIGSCGAWVLYFALWRTTRRALPSPSPSY